MATLSLNRKAKLLKRIVYFRIRNARTESTNVRKLKSRFAVGAQWKLLTLLGDFYSKLPYNKAIEFSKFLQMYQQPFVKTINRSFEAIALPKVENTEKKQARPKEVATITDVINNIKKLKTSIAVDVKKTPHWKCKSFEKKKIHLMSQSKAIGESLSTVNNNDSIQERIERLTEHIKLHPETKHNLIKEGVICNLLKIRQNNPNKDIKATAREALSLLGYTDPLPGKGIKILSIDGGGVRGLLVIEMLKRLEELTGKRVYELFDLICGVSTGAILSSLMVVHRIPLEDLSKMYKEISVQIFQQSALQGTTNLVWSHSYYDTSVFENILKSNFGDLSLSKTSRLSPCPKLCAISAVVNQSRLSAYVFRNYSLPWKVQSQYMGGCDHLVWEAVRASAAAPTYFEEFRLGHLVHQDGGILVNNPTAVAIHEAKLLWPNSPIQCVVSFGTGRTAPNPNLSDETIAPSNSSWKGKFMKIIESATDTEGVHMMLADLLPKDVYFRFNPYLTEMLNMEETDSKKLEQLERDALMYLRRNEDKFQDAAKVLEKEKSYAYKFLDWISLKRQTLGFALV